MILGNPLAAQRYLRSDKCPCRERKFITLWSSQTPSLASPAVSDSRLPIGYPERAMYDLKTLSGLLNLSEKQVRQRLTVLRPLLDGHVTVGRYGKILATDQALALFRRLGELEAMGLTLQAAVERMARELQKPHTNGDPQPSPVGQASADLIEELRARIKHLEDENLWLRRQIEELQARLPALPPAQISRWQALKIAILGR